MTINVQNPLPNSLWEKFAQEIKSGHSRTEAYMSTYGITDRTKASRSAWRLMQNEAIKGRVVFLSPLAVKEEVDLKSVIHTCQTVIEDSESTPQKLKAIEVLNKLGVFDNESKTIQRMDPAALCEYLAQFASHPARELEHIPGGLSGLMKRLIALTGASKESMIEALNEATDEATDVKVDVKAPEEVEDKDDEDFPMDEDTQDDETLVETIDAPAEGEPSEAMKEKLAPALELAKELEAEDEKVEF